MSIEDIRALRNAEPFQPFEILLQSGRALQIQWKEAVSFTPSGRQILVDVGSAFTRLELPSIVELRVRASRSARPV